MKRFDVLILGAGASGCYAAIHAAAAGLTVGLIEKNSQIGRKIMVSGGGRCNFTNLNAQAEHYLAQPPQFVLSALKRHSPQAVLAWFEAQGLQAEEKAAGQLFCRQKSRGVVAALERALWREKVAIFYDVNVSEVRHQEALFTVNQQFSAPYLVVATGGASYPKLGASTVALSIAKQFRIKNQAFKPALVPLQLAEPYSHLSGISSRVRVSCEQAPVFEDDLLFTHRGLSGPAILQISSYWHKGSALTIDCLPQLPEDAFVAAKTSASHLNLKQFLRQYLPQKWGETWATPLYEKRLAECKNEDLRAAEALWRRWTVQPTQSTGMAQAEVCTGGVACSELQPQSMACKRLPELYFIGEAVDVTGWLGGYNFQWAWSSAWLCAQDLIQKRFQT